MRTRIFSGAMLVVILFLTLFLGKWTTFAGCLFISMVGMYELIKVKGVEKKSIAVVGYTSALAYYAILLFHNDASFILLLLVSTCIVLMMIYVFTFPKYKTEEVMWVFFSIVYVAMMLSYIYQVRIMDDGLFIVFLIFIASWGNDTCAYFTGVFLGKHKMTPVLSPKKTYEGAVGGVVGATLIGFLYGFITSVVYFFVDIQFLIFFKNNFCSLLI